jgi:uncharacterized membrane protein YoaK (UPF0700 family)
MHMPFLKKSEEFLECERWWILAALMYVGGFFGGFTYSVRGGIFCNAQTANFVLLAMSVGSGDWAKARYLLIPITAYFLGAVVSELVAGTIKRFHLIRWDTLLLLIEMLVVIVLGFIPDNAPFEISQVAVNFICSMQYNTFRQADGIPMATTFCTNHIRQVGVFFTKGIRHAEAAHFRRMLFHAGMLTLFTLGGIMATIACNHLGGKGVWFALLPLGIAFCDLLHADLHTEKGEMERKPRGH